MHQIRRTALRWHLCKVIAAMALLTVAACGGEPPSDSGEFPVDAMPEAQTAVVVLDTSASVLEGTDLLAATQTRIHELIGQMPIGGTVAVKALNNVAARCNDLTFTLAAEKNETVLAEARDAMKRDAPGKVEKYVECATEDDNAGGTQLFGLLAETAVSYPRAQIWDVYTDGLDNHDVAGLHRRKNLRNPDYPEDLVAGLHPALVPTLSPDTTIIWHALGRGSDLDATELAGLRRVYELWTARTGATAKVETN